MTVVYNNFLLCWMFIIFLLTSILYIFRICLFFRRSNARVAARAELWNEGGNEPRVRPYARHVGRSACRHRRHQGNRQRFVHVRRPAPVVGFRWGRGGHHLRLVAKIFFPGKLWPTLSPHLLRPPYFRRSLRPPVPSSVVFCEIQRIDKRRPENISRLLNGSLKSLISLIPNVQFQNFSVVADRRFLSITAQSTKSSFKTVFVILIWIFFLSLVQ